MTEISNDHLTTYQSSNFKKHTSQNPLQRLLIDNFHRTAADLYSQTHAQVVLDAGCGEGFGIEHAMQQGNTKIVGLDNNIGALYLAQQRHRNYNFTSGNLYSLPFPSLSFDLVVCMEVLEHLDNPAKGLIELLRVSRRWLLLSVPHEPFFRGANFLRGKNMATWGNDPGHINHWSARGFAHFVSRHTHIVDQRQSFPWTLILCEKK